MLSVFLFAVALKKTDFNFLFRFSFSYGIWKTDYKSFSIRQETGGQSPYLRGPPRKNQTKMNFFRQGSKIEILSIFADK